METYAVQTKEEILLKLNDVLERMAHMEKLFVLVDWASLEASARALRPAVASLDPSLGLVCSPPTRGPPGLRPPREWAGDAPAPEPSLCVHDTDLHAAAALPLVSVGVSEPEAEVSPAKELAGRSRVDDQGGAELHASNRDAGCDSGSDGMDVSSDFSDLELAIEKRQKAKVMAALDTQGTCSGPAAPLVAKARSVTFAQPHLNLTAGGITESGCEGLRHDDRKVKQQLFKPLTRSSLCHHEDEWLRVSQTKPSLSVARSQPAIRNVVVGKPRKP